MALPKKGYKPGIYRFVSGTVDGNGDFSITNIPKDGYVSGIYQLTEVTIDADGNTSVAEDDIGITAAIEVTVDGSGDLSVTEVPEEGYVSGVYRVTTSTNIPKEGFNQIDFSAVIGTISGGKWESGPGIQFNAALTNSLIPSSAVAATYTFARADTDATVTDFEGLVKDVTANEARFHGARRVHNLATGLVTETITVVSGSEYQVTIAGGSGDTAVASGAFTGTLTANGTNRISWNSGTPKTAASTSLTLTVTGTLTEMLVEDVTGQANQNPSENIVIGAEHGTNAGNVKYLDYENGNTVSVGGVVTESQGAAITTLEGVLVEEARTNILPDSVDISSMGVGGAPTVAVSATASPLQGTSAWDITDDAASYENLNDVVTIGSTDVITLTWFVKKETGPISHWPGLWIQMGGGSTLVCNAIFDPTDGSYNPESGGNRVDYDEFIAEDYNADWWKVIAKKANNGTGNTNLTWRLYPAVSTNGTTVTAAATGTTTIAIPQVEVGEWATSYIPTGAAAATRNVEALSYPNTNILDDEGTLAFTFTPNGNTAGYTGEGDRALVGVRGVNADLIHIDTTTGKLILSDGTNETVPTTLPPLVVGAATKIAIRWSATAGTMQIRQDAVEVSATFDGSMNKSAALRIGYSGGNRASGTYKNMIVYNGAVNDATFTGLTA